MTGRMLAVLVIVALLVLSMVTFGLLRSSCEARGGTFEYAVTYKTYICVGAER